MDALAGQLPGVGMICNYIFNPSYIITTEEGAELFRITKEPSFWGGLFKIDKLEVDSNEEIRCTMGLSRDFLEQSS